MSSTRELRTAGAKLIRSMGKRTKSQGKNTDLNTYLDPSPSGLPPPVVFMRLTFVPESGGCQHKTHFHPSVSLHYFSLHLRRFLLVQQRDLSPAPSRGDEPPSSPEKGSGFFVIQFSFFLVPFSL